MYFNVLISVPGVSLQVVYKHREDSGGYPREPVAAPGRPAAAPSGDDARAGGTAPGRLVRRRDNRPRCANIRSEIHGGRQD